MHALRLAADAALCPQSKPEGGKNNDTHVNAGVNGMQAPFHAHDMVLDMVLLEGGRWGWYQDVSMVGVAHVDLRVSVC